MSFSRNWLFSLSGEDEQAIIIKKAKDNALQNVTCLKLFKNNNNTTRALIVLKTQVRKSAVRKMFHAADIEPVSSPKEVLNSMGKAIFGYGKLLNKDEKKLASKASSYSQAVQYMAEKPLIPEDEPKFELVYNIIATAETEAEGMLKVFEDFPLWKHLIIPAMRRLKLKKSKWNILRRW